MNFFFQLIIMPIRLLLEFIYCLSNSVLHNSGLSIIPLSLAVNFLLLPLYVRADAIQRFEQDRQKQMEPYVKHIKQTFHGDERFMILQTCYRQFGYKPVYSLRTAIPLLLQIPFFVAAYGFLSTLSDLNGATFGPIRNLGIPDGLVSICGININILPILMTIINFVSSAIYAKEMKLSRKLQFHALALIFLILLYKSPSGLVLYWTMNNLFSLVKNIVYDKMTHNEKEKKSSSTQAEIVDKKSSTLFVLGSVFLTLQLGVLIPTSVIHASPAEFVNVFEYQSPFKYIVNSTILAAGVFIVWLGLFYYLASTKIKKVFSSIIWVFSGISIVNCMGFNKDFGNLSSALVYDRGMNFSLEEYLTNSLEVLALSALLLLVWMKKKNVVRTTYGLLITVMFVLSVVDFYGINKSLVSVKKLVERENRERATFRLSKTGNNVIVFMLDRAISSYVPYMFQENPDLVRQFDGFVWYPNCLSYSTNTNTGTPSLFGGYEYTPEEINKRDDEYLVDKQNEALKVMPLLFDEANFEVTVCDPPYAGYTWIPDLSIFDDYEGIRAFNTESGQFVNQKSTLRGKQNVWNRNLFCYSLMKSSPYLIQPLIYQDGTYYNKNMSIDVLKQVQYINGLSVAEGIGEEYINSKAALESLSDMTVITDEQIDTFLMIENGITHNVIMLQEPQYEPAMHVDNTEYDKDNVSRFTVNGKRMTVENGYQISHYQCNMAAFLLLGEWMDFLRENDVYDNTRIIIVADHGWGLEQFDDMKFGEVYDFEEGHNSEDIMSYNPLLMVKDFESTGFKTDNQFMTNADTPVIAMQGLINNPHNPFTGNKISSEEKYNFNKHIFYTKDWSTETNNGKTFLPGIWYNFSGDDIFDVDAWKKIDEH